MSQLLDRFIDLNVKFERMSRKEIEVKHKKIIDLIINETVGKLGDATDYIVDSLVATITCVITYNKKFTQEHYDKIKTITSFAILPPFKEYKKSVENMQKNPQKVIKDFFSSVNKYRSVLNEKYFPYCVELLATLNGEIEFLMMYTKLFKG